MEIFDIIALGVLGLMFSAGLSICAGLIASGLVITKRIKQKMFEKRFAMLAKQEPLPYTVNYSKIEDQHGNAHESVMIQYKPETETVKHEPVKEIPVNEPPKKAIST